MAILDTLLDTLRTGTSDEILRALKDAKDITDDAVIEVIAIWKTSEFAGVRKECKKLLERGAATQLQAFAAVFKGTIGDDDVKFSKKLATVDDTAFDVPALASAVIARTDNNLGLFYLCAVGGDRTREALQAAIDDDGRLDLSGCKVLPNELAQLEGLTELNLSGCGLRTLPPVLFELTTLKKLNLMENRLGALPDGLAKLVALEELVLRNAPLNKGVGKLPPLKTLKIYFAKMKDPRPLLLPSLEVLVLFDVGFTEMPNEIGDLKKIRELDWPRDAPSIPEELWTCEKLEKLDLSGALVEEISNKLGKLKRLRTLNLRGAKIHSLPNAIGELRELKEIDVVFAGNLTSLPESFCSLELEKLRIQYTPLEAQTEAIKERMPNLRIYK